MGVYAIWPSAVCLAVILAMIGTRPFAPADAPPGDGSSRIPTLDGLRGIVALAVVLHHAAIYHRFLLDGVWTLPPSAFYQLLGQGGVGLFFMVTGYLFWSRVLREQGRPSWWRFAVGRVFRIAPVYLLATFAMFLLVAEATGWRLRVPFGEFSLDAGRWLALGLFTGDPVNGVPDAQLLLAGVTWTLRYEWLFYLTLPALALAAKRPAWSLPLTAAGFALSCLWLLLGQIWGMTSLEPSIVVLFGCGMISASLHARGLARSVPDAAGSCAVALVVAAIGLWPNAYQLPALLLLGLAFHLIASGCSVFGLLTLRPTRRLGDISYGVYLLQGLALALVFRPSPLRAFALGSPLAHWMLTLTALVLLVCLATVVHIWVERPGIVLGKRVAGWRWRKLDISLAGRL